MTRLAKEVRATRPSFSLSKKAASASASARGRGGGVSTLSHSEKPCQRRWPRLLAALLPLPAASLAFLYYVLGVVLRPGCCH